MKLAAISIFAAAIAAFAGEPNQRIQANGLDVGVFSNIAPIIRGLTPLVGEQMVMVIATDKTLAADQTIIGWAVTYTATLADGSSKPVTLLLAKDSDGIAGQFLNLGAVITGISDLKVAPLRPQVPLLVALQE